MNQKVILQIIFLLGLFIFACKSPYQPEGLRKLSNEEMYEQTRTRSSVMGFDIVFKNEKGEIISLDSIGKIPNFEKYTTDVYVNDKGVQKELILRLANEEDLKRRQKLKEIRNMPPVFDLIEDFNCENVKDTLVAVSKKDKEDNMFAPGSDAGNQRVVVSIIEKCGFPTVELHGSASVETVFSVLKQAEHPLIEKYFPMIKESAKKGDLDWNRVASMEDRLLVVKDKKQKYGTHVERINSERYELQPLEDPEYVDKRRKEIGLEPLSEYLKEWDIVFDVEQKE